MVYSGCVIHKTVRKPKIAYGNSPDEDFVITETQVNDEPVPFNYQTVPVKKWSQKSCGDLDLVSS